MASSFTFFIFSSILFFTISSSIAKTSFRPKAVILPVVKDITSSTPQYVTQIKQRTPLVPVNLTVDLGSGYLWEYFEDNYTSSTDTLVLCGSAQCKFFRSQCVFSDSSCVRTPFNTISGLNSYGDVHSDVVSFRSTDGNNIGKSVTVPHFPFVRAYSSNQFLLAFDAIGMAGLGRTKASLPSLFSSAFSFSRKFAVCLSSSTGASGAIIFGDAPYKFYIDLSNTLTYTPLLINPVSPDEDALAGEPSPEYFIGVKSIKVANKKVELNTTLLAINRKTGTGGTKISTVNPYTVLETTIYKAVSEAFVEALGVRTVSPVQPFGTCFSDKDISFSRMGPSVPDIYLVLQNEVVWTIIGSNSMVRASDNVICLGFVDAAGLDHSKPVSSITIGGYQLENNLLEFDLARSRLGFRSVFLEHTNCENFNFTSA